MPELSLNDTDLAISRLLSEGPLPTVAIADRLAIPGRTIRHRLMRLRETGQVAKGLDGLHRLAAALPGLAGPADGDLAAPGLWAVAKTPWDLPERSGSWQGLGPVLAGLAIVVIALAAAVVGRKATRQPSPVSPVDDQPDDLWRSIRW